MKRLVPSVMPRVGLWLRGWIDDQSDWHSENHIRLCRWADHYLLLLLLLLLLGLRTTLGLGPGGTTSPNLQKIWCRFDSLPISGRPFPAQFTQMPSPRASPNVGVGPQRWTFFPLGSWSCRCGLVGYGRRRCVSCTVVSGAENLFCFFGLAKPDVNVVRYTEQWNKSRKSDLFYAIPVFKFWRVGMTASLAVFL